MMTRFLSVFLALALLVPALQAQLPFGGDRLTTELISESSTIAPGKPFTIAGQFQTAGYDAPDLSLARMREYAAALGLDGVAMIRCNLGKLSLPKDAGKSTTMPETVVDSPKKGDCAGQGFVWVTR